MENNMQKVFFVIFMLFYFFLFVRVSCGQKLKPHKSMRNLWRKKCMLYVVDGIFKHTLLVLFYFDSWNVEVEVDVRKGIRIKDKKECTLYYSLNYKLHSFLGIFVNLSIHIIWCLLFLLCAIFVPKQSWFNMR